MANKKNPYIEPENYFAAYEESIKKNQDDPEALKLDKLCYQLFFVNKDGAELLKIFEEKFISPSLVRVGDPEYPTLVTYFEGFKEAFRMIKSCVHQHSQRIKAGNE